MAVANRMSVHHKKMLGKGTQDFATLCPTQEVNGLLVASKSYKHVLLTGLSQGQQQFNADFSTAFN
jgi:hypothetical protein